MTKPRNPPVAKGSKPDKLMRDGAVNNSARQNMADMRTAFNDLIWFQYGSGSKSSAPLYASGTSFTQTSGSDLSAVYHVGRRVKAVGSDTGTIYGAISNTSFGSSTQTVTVVWDSGSFSNEVLTISLSQIPVIGNPIGLAKQTWTPVLTDGTHNAASYFTQAGTYTKIGNRVFFELALTPNSLGSLTGSVFIIGLPFAVSSSAPSFFAVASSMMLAGVTEAELVAGQSIIHLYAVGPASKSAIAASDIAGGDQFAISGSYPTD